MPASCLADPASKDLTVTIVETIFNSFKLLWKQFVFYGETPTPVGVEILTQKIEIWNPVLQNLFE